MPTQHPSRLLELLRDCAIRGPDAVALLAPGRTALNYADLLTAVEGTSDALRSFGIGSGDRVAVLLSNGPEMAVTFLAVAGMAACAPLNPVYQTGEIELCFDDLRPKALIIQSSLDSPARAVAARRGVPVIELRAQVEQPAGIFELLGEAAAAPSPQALVAPDALALLLHTSGTTARPKLIPLTQANLCHAAYTIAASLELRGEDRCLNVMPLFHIHGLVGGLLASLAAGASVVCTPGFYARSFFDWLGEFRPSWYTAVPTMHAAILSRVASHGSAVAEHNLRFIRSCSAALPVQILNELERVFAIPVVEAYGMSEAAHQIAANPLPPRQRKPRSVGLPTGVSVAVMDAAGKLLNRGETGEIVIQGESVTRGYLGDAAVNERAFIGAWLRTGDIGRLDAEGYIFIEGRSKEIINRAGVKISPHEIEEVLLDHPDIAEALAFAVPDTRLGEVVGVAVIPRGSAALDATELRSFVGDRLAHFKVPRHIAIVTEIAKGATGKPQRSGVAARLGLVADDPPAPDPTAFIPPRTPIEMLLAAMARRILGIERIGAFDDFFASGGDSLTAMQFLLSIEQVTGTRLSLACLFEAPTIAQLATLLTEGVPAQPEPRILPVQPAGTRQPFFCIGAGPMLWKLANALGPDQPFFSLMMPPAAELPEPCRMADIARPLAATIRSVQPDGPYALGGFCVDGIIAYEIAQQLRADGQEVDLLVLFDAVNPARFEDLSPLQGAWAQACIAGRKLSFHLGRLWNLPVTKAPAYLLARLETLRLFSLRFFWRLGHALTPKHAPPSAPAERNPEKLRRLAEKFYRPQSYPGRVVLFRRSLRPIGGYLDTALGWGPVVTGGLTVEIIPGEHVDMFTEPHVALTAEKLAAQLAQSSGRPVATTAAMSSTELPSRSALGRVAAVMAQLFY